MPNKKLLLISFLILSLVVVAAPGCKKPAPVIPEPVAPPPAAPEPTPEPVEVVEPKLPVEPPVEKPVDLSAEEIKRSGVLKTVYFDFDRSELTAEARSTLRQNAEWMKDNQKWKLVVEGHCDERGTIEYNIELGQRRARAVREFLDSLGVSSSRVRSVSYGEERPDQPGHTESAWARNRRAEFNVE